MARMVRILNTGELVVDNKVINIVNMLFKSTNGIVDIDGNIVLNYLLLAVASDFANIDNKITNNESIMATKVDKIHVNNVASQKADIGQVILKSDIDSVRSEQALVSGPTTAVEGDILTYTIDNYSINNVYEILTTIGTITYNGTNTFTIEVSQVNANISGVVNVTTAEPHKVKSLVTSIAVNVYNISYTMDQLVINANFNLNVDYNDGYTF